VFVKLILPAYWRPRTRDPGRSSTRCSRRWGSRRWRVPRRRGPGRARDEHVMALTTDDRPDLVVRSVYITLAYRAYQLADHYRRRGSHVALGGLHVMALPDEAARHADTVFLGPGEDTWPGFLAFGGIGRSSRVAPQSIGARPQPGADLASWRNRRRRPVRGCHRVGSSHPEGRTRLHPRFGGSGALEEQQGERITRPTLSSVPLVEAPWRRCSAGGPCTLRLVGSGPLT
jgi:hypothetical protein